MSWDTSWDMLKQTTASMMAEVIFREMEKSMTKEEAFEYLKTLTPYAEKHKDQFEEEWETIKTLPREQQEIILRYLAREIEAKEIKPPKIERPIPEIKEWIDYVPEHKRDFYKRWMEKLKW